MLAKKNGIAGFLRNYAAFSKDKNPLLPSLRYTHLSHTKFFFQYLTWYDFHKKMIPMIIVFIES